MIFYIILAIFTLVYIVVPENCYFLVIESKSGKTHLDFKDLFGCILLFTIILGSLIKTLL